MRNDRNSTSGTEDDVRRWIFSILVTLTVSPAAASAADAPGHVTGIGGVFVLSTHPKALAAWYRDVLGFAVQPWNGAIFRYGSRRPPLAVWTVFPAGADEFAHSHRDFMINLTVDNLDALAARLKAKNVRIIKRSADAFGKYASILDLDGTKVELWQPVLPKRSP